MSDLQLNFSGFEPNGLSKYLCILIHGYGSFPLLKKYYPPKWNAKTKLNDLKAIIKEANFSKNQEKPDIKNIDIYFPDLTKEMGIVSVDNPNDIVKKILEDIDKIWEKKEYENIYIIGYSMGALLARKVYVCACGSNPEAPLEKEFNDLQLPKKWADKVDRIILLAGLNRGWSINHHLSRFWSILWTIGAGLGNLTMLLCRKPPLVFTIRKGASFITQLRIQWIYMRRKTNEKNVGNALTIQLLGTEDKFVSPEDNIDLVSGKDFVYLEVRFSNHLNVVEMAKPKTDNSDEYDKYEKRRKVFLSALTDDVNPLQEQSQKLTNAIEELTLKHKRTTENPDEITDVIFVIHGIRDEGHWTNRIAQRVISQNEEANKNRSEQNQRHFAIETSRYGYFPMLLFALPWTRRAKVAWFMDQYAENLVLYPKAKFSFIGHSNGTYLLAQAIKEYQCCKFKRIVFAGSVVPKEYPWDDYIGKRVEKVLNYVATCDWVVAIFPNFLHWFQRDLGSAGHDGFNAQSQVTNIKYIRGDHGAALSEYNWDVIAKFIVHDSIDIEELKHHKIFKFPRGKCIEIIGKIPWIIWMLIIILFSFVGYSILFLSTWGEWQKTVVFLIYLWGIWKILTII